MPIITWNRLGSANQIANSELGNNGSGTPNGYLPCKWGNGSDIDAYSDNIQFSGDLADSFGIDKWAIEVLLKPNWDSNETTNRKGIISQPSTSVGLNLFWFTAKDFRVSFRVDQMGVQIVSGGHTFSSGDILQFRIVFNTSGIDGSGDKIRLYLGINGAIPTDIGSVAGTSPSTNVSEDIKLGSYWDDTVGWDADGVLDNYKIWDYDNIDFANSANVEGFGGAKRRTS